MAAVRARLAAFHRKLLAASALDRHSASIRTNRVHTMLHQLLTNTPRWVWILLIALAWLGMRQTLSRTVSLKRITLVPLAMLGLSLYGTVSAFGTIPQIMLTWLVAGACVATAVLQTPLPAATRYDPVARRFTQPGSWVPLLLIMGIFVTRYVVGAISAIQPALLQDLRVSLSFAALYGGASAAFLARAARLWRMALAAERLPRTIVVA